MSTKVAAAVDHMDAERSKTARRAGPPGADRDSTLSARFMGAFVQAMEQAGVPRAALLRAARIEPQQLEAANARLRRSEAHRIFATAMDLTKDPALGEPTSGVRVAASVPPPAP